MDKTRRIRRTKAAILALVAISGLAMFVCSVRMLWLLANGQPVGDWMLCVPMFSLCAAWFVMAIEIDVEDDHGTGVCVLRADRCSNRDRQLACDYRVGG